MTIAFGITAYLVLSFLFCWAVGSGMKRARAHDLGISLDEDTRRQDEAQLHYIRTGDTINVID